MGMSANETPVTPAWARPLAALVCGIQGVVLLGFCAFYLYELVIGEGDDAARVVMSIALMALTGVALLAMARAWRSGGTWPRTPTILRNLLMLPVAWSMHGGGFWGAWPLAVAAILAIVAALMSGRHESDAVV